jgi:hypothetical protein
VRSASSIKVARATKASRPLASSLKPERPPCAAMSGAIHCSSVVKHPKVALSYRPRKVRMVMEYRLLYSRTRFRSWALIATITVLADISTAPSAGVSSTPRDASTPAASGMAMML